MTLGESDDDDSDDESSDLEDNTVFEEKAPTTQGKTIIKKATEIKVTKKKKEDPSVSTSRKAGVTLASLKEHQQGQEDRRGEDRVFLHPRVCDKLLRHGHGRAGCKGAAGCTSFTPTWAPPPSPASAWTPSAPRAFTGKSATPRRQGAEEGSSDPSLPGAALPATIPHVLGPDLRWQPWRFPPRPPPPPPPARRRLL